jgi:ADP-heptose:LPS heptosyltransferase
VWRHLTAHRVPLPQGHDLEQNLQLIEALGLPHAAAQLWPCLSVPADLAERGARYLAAQGFDPQARYVGLHTGCDGAWVEKRWPETHFAALAEKLHERHGLAAIVMDGPAEIGTGRRVARLARTPVLAMDGYGDLADA